MSSSLDLITHTDAEGSGGCAALIFGAQGRVRGACLLKSRVACEDPALAQGNNRIFVIELYTVASARRSLGDTSPGAPAAISIRDYSAAQVLTKGGPNHLLINHVVRAFWFLAACESLGVWLERASSWSGPADTPSRDGLPPVAISRERAPLSLKKRMGLSPVLNLDRLPRQKRKSQK